MKSFAALFILLALFPAGIKSQIQKADLIIINADIRTLDEKKPRAASIAVSGNKIIFAGKDSETKKFTGPNTKIIDAKGRLVIPGFNDAHVHILGMGNMFSTADLRLAKTPQDLAEKIKYQAGFLPKNRWILGGQWNNENWSPNDLPTKSLIDDFTPENPVLLYNSKPDTAFANSAALKAAGITETVKNPSGGQFVRDRDGKLTGVLKGSAIYLVRRAAPASHGKDLPAIAETATNYAAAYGVTSMQDMSADDNRAVFRELEKQGKLKTRIYDCSGLSEWLKINSPQFIKNDESEMVRGGCLKYFTEADEESIPELTKKLASADKSGWQIMIHAIGGAANAAILDVFENVAKENGARDRRFRVEHAHNIRSGDIKRFGASKIVASMQPALFFGGFSDNSEPYRTLLDSNVRIAFGSDSAMIPVNPFDGIYAAVMKTDFSVEAKNRSFSVEEAVRLYTAGAAYAEFQEDVKGTLAAGKYADFIILSQDIFSIPAEKIPDTKVLLTVVNGKIVYEEK